MIYTSYFANYRKFPSDYIPISIARFTPNAYRGKQLRKYAPPRKLLEAYKDGKVTEDKYRKVYVAYLEKHIDPFQAVDELDNHILLCYEKREDFCHRHILADWLQEYINIEIQEL